MKGKKSPNKSPTKSDDVKIIESKSKKVKSEPIEIDVSPQKEDNSPVAVASPAFDPLEKRKQRAENYKRFIASHKEGAKNPGCKEVPEVSPQRVILFFNFNCDKFRPGSRRLSGRIKICGHWSSGISCTRRS